MPPLFLTGFMAAGKSSVGRAIAAASARPFVDLDDRIAALGEPVAALVARDEAEFRRREAAALDALLGEDALVIATGGGAAAYGDNLARMRRAGLVVALGVDLDEAQRRASGGPPRPLLANAAELAAARAPVYRRAHAVVDTMGKTIEQVARAVLDVERVWHQLPPAHRDATLVALEDRTYPVSVTDTLDRELVRAQGSRIAVVTDRNVLPHAADLGEVLAIEPGEASKAFATYARLCEELVARGLDRGSTIVAVGGGVVGDLAGFVAATLYRGISVIHVPTTIVAMTDSAIGGKTAIDLPAGKNLVGAFWQPRLVTCGLDTLATLPARERRAGFGELWKYAVLDGSDLWSAVDACAPWAAGPEGTPAPAELRPVIERAIAFKAAIVGRDERERTGHRALLNLGHTVGHAIESASGMLHGEAVALGLLAAARVSAAICGTPSLESALARALARTGLPTDLDRWLTDDVLARVQVDKKRIGANLRFIVARGVGSCEPVEIAITELRRILRPVPPA